jgi:hypothetical protein
VNWGVAALEPPVTGTFICRDEAAVVTGRDTEVQGQRRRTGIGRAAAGFALLAALAGCGAGAKPAAGDGGKATAAPVSATHRASPAASGSASEQPPPRATPTPTRQRPSALPVGPANVGALPQTSALPKTTGTAFGNAVHDIWLAVSTGDPDYAKPAFFPVQAYEQVKAIANPESDWQNRLWYDFKLDLAAAHKLVGKNAKLVKVVTPTQYAQWIPAGGCYNSIGYWHLPGSRLVYRTGGVTHSFGLASFISWRGDWYLVHLGALVRSGAYGIVDDPETGPGVPGPPGGC